MSTMTLAIDENQVIDLVRQLSIQSKQIVFAILLSEIDLLERWAAHGQKQIHELALQHGVNWERMNEGERETFLDQLLHEA